MSRRLSLLVFIYLFTRSLASFAFPVASQKDLSKQQGRLIQNIRFDQPHEVPENERFQNFDQAVGASVQLDLYTVPASWIERPKFSGSCTGVFTSKSGHLITDRHCIEGCLKSRGVLKKEDVVKDIYKDIVDVRKLPETTCPIGIGGKTYEAKVLSAGVCRIHDDTPGITHEAVEIVEKSAKQGCGNNADFAVLQFPPEIAGTCAKVAHEDVNVGDPIWSIGYPGETSKPAGFNSDGKSKYVSKGQRTCGFKDYSEFPRLFEPEVLQDLAAPVAQLLQSYDREGALKLLEKTAEADVGWYGSQELYFGMSGGGTFNQKGELVGLNQGTGMISKSALAGKAEKPGLSNVTPISAIKKQIVEINGANAVKEFFTCPGQ